MKYLLLVLVTTALIGCSDRIEDSLKGRCVYAGKIFLIDSLGGEQSRIETDSIVKVTLYKAGINNFLYQRSTVNKGNFVLDFLQSKQRYRIEASLKISGVSYKGDTTFIAEDKDDRKYYLNLINDTIPLALYANVDKRNIINIPIVDKNGAVIPKADGCLFTSRELFATSNCLNANYSATGDVSGKLIFTNVKEGFYYLFVQKRLDTTAGAPVIKGIDSFQITASGVAKRPAITIK